MPRYNLNCEAVAIAIANRLTKGELIELATLLASDVGNDFNHFIQQECKRVAPEWFVLFHALKDVNDKE